MLIYKPFFQFDVMEKRMNRKNGNKNRWDLRKWITTLKLDAESKCQNLRMKQRNPLNNNTKVIKIGAQKVAWHVNNKNKKKRTQQVFVLNDTKKEREKFFDSVRLT